MFSMVALGYSFAWITFAALALWDGFDFDFEGESRSRVVTRAVLAYVLPLTLLFAIPEFLEFLGELLH